jgi:hypothetical protein
LRVNDLQVEHGGLLFYELGEELSGADTPALQQVLYFCVSHGFEGRLAGDPAALLDYRQRLRRRVPSSMPARRSSYAGGFTRPLSSPVRFYAASSLSVAVFYAALCWLSN